MTAIPEASPPLAEDQSGVPARRRRWIDRHFPPLSPRQWRVFWLVTTAGYFENYDRALLNLALKQIQTSLRIGEAQLGKMLSLIRLGYFLALLITPLADRIGRRRLLLYTVVAYTLTTGLSALAPDERSFVTLQVLARGFTAAESAIAVVILAEEVAAAVRGWTIGLLGALAACGWGMAALVFALINVVPFGWRGLYALALIPLAIIIPLRKNLPETGRFEKAEGAFQSRNLLAPFGELFRKYTARLTMLLSVSFLMGMGAYSTGMFTSKYLQEAHQWTPARVSSLIVLGGALGILGNIVAGRLSDRIGRRTMGSGFLLLAPLATWVFLNSGGSVMVVSWILYLFFDSAATTILNAYGAELFPTSARSTATVAVTVAATLGGALGLYLEALLYGLSNSHWQALSWLTAFWMVAPFIMILTFPETAGLELEVTSAETRPQFST